MFLYIESRNIYLREILDWSDNYVENFSSTEMSSTESENALKSIVQLWLEYASMEKYLRQWKKAQQIYEDALKDNIVSKSPEIFISYGNYYKERGKLPNAQKVYLRALTSNLQQNDVDEIWMEYLDTMRKNGSPALTMDQLYNAVSKQVESKTQLLSKPSSDAIAKSSVSSISANSAVAAPNKKPGSASEPGHADTLISNIAETNFGGGSKSDQSSVPVEPTSASRGEEGGATTTEGTLKSLPSGFEARNSGILTNVEDLVTLADLNDIGDFEPDQLLRTYSKRPPMLFCAPDMVRHVTIPYYCGGM